MKRSKYIFIILLSLSLVILNSCVTTLPVSIEAWKDSSYKGPKFHKIMVVAIVKDLAYKKSYENAMVSYLKDQGIKAIPSLKIFSPKRDYSEKEMNDLVAKNSVDGILTLKYIGIHVTNVIYKGKTYYQYYYDGLSTYTTPTYVEKHHEVNVECTLFAQSSGNAVWMAQTKTSNYSDLDDLTSMLAQKVTENLVESKMIP